MSDVHYESEEPIVKQVHADSAPIETQDSHILKSTNHQEIALSNAGSARSIG